MENIRVIANNNNYFKHADIVKVQLWMMIYIYIYIGQIMPGDENDSFTFELCLEDNSHMPFWKDNIKDIVMANDKEVFTYAFILGQNIKE